MLSDVRYYHSGFPACGGLEDPKWSYDVHSHGSFKLNADYSQEYVLYMNVHNGSHSVSAQAGGPCMPMFFGRFLN